MDDLTLIKFKVTDKHYGFPEPFIPNNYIVLLIQEGKVQISRYNEPTDDNPFPTFEHPNDNAVNKALESHLLKAIKEKHPQYLLSDRDIVVTCPENIVEKIIW
jgi:hypothetical protein